MGDYFRIKLPTGSDGVAFWAFVTVMALLICKWKWGVTLW